MLVTESQDEDKESTSLGEGVGSRAKGESHTGMNVKGDNVDLMYPRKCSTINAIDCDPWHLTVLATARWIPSGLFFFHFCVAIVPEYFRS